MAKENRVSYDISWEALLKVAAFLAALWALFVLKGVFLFMLVAFIFVAAVNPTIVYLQRYMSRSLAVILFYVVLVLLMLGVLSLFIPLVVHQINELVRTYPALVDRFRPYLSEGQADEYRAILTQISDSAGRALTSFSQGIIERGASFFGGLITFLTFLVITFYLLLEERNAKDFFHQVLPRHRFQAVYVTVQKISEKMGFWIRGQVVLMVIIGLANYLVFVALGVPTPLPLAIWAGFTEIIPYVGPVLGVIPAVGVALINGDILQAVLIIAICWGLIQQLEASFVVPRVMGKAIGLSPVLVILSILVGVQLFGVLGAVIAVPAAAIVSVIVEEWPNLRKLWKSSEPEAV